MVRERGTKSFSLQHCFLLRRGIVLGARFRVPMVRTVTRHATVTLFPPFVNDGGRVRPLWQPFTSPVIRAAWSAHTFGPRVSFAKFVTTDRGQYGYRYGLQHWAVISTRLPKLRSFAIAVGAW